MVHEEISASALAAASAEALDRPLTGAAELLVATACDDALVLGAFQRSGELPESTLPLFRRGSGGAEIRVSPGAVWVQLALSRADALVPCEPNRLLNRYVRPLLKALGAAYFDRDWVAKDKQVLAAVAFGHDATSGRALFEAVVAGDAPIAIRDRASFRGRPRITARADARLIAQYYADAYPALVDAPRPSGGAATVVESAWTATRDEAIGVIGAAPGAIGGELMASRDALEALVRAESDAEIDAIFTRPNVALFGVRSLLTFRDLLRASSSE